MAVVWLNGTVGSGKSVVGRALAASLPGAKFMDGDWYAGPRHLPEARRWRMALDVLLAAVLRSRGTGMLVVAYPLDLPGYRALRARCARAHTALLVVNLAPPLPMTLRGRGGRLLSRAETARIRAMRAKGYHRRPFAALTLPNADPPASRTARTILRHLRGQSRRLVDPRVSARCPKQRKPPAALAR
jgi:hypothetical protein